MHFELKRKLHAKNPIRCRLVEVAGTTISRLASVCIERSNVSFKTIFLCIEIYLASLFLGASGMNRSISINFRNVATSLLLSLSFSCKTFSNYSFLQLIAMWTTFSMGVQCRRVYAFTYSNDWSEDELVNIFRFQFHFSMTHLLSGHLKKLFGRSYYARQPASGWSIEWITEIIIDTSREKNEKEKSKWMTPKVVAVVPQTQYNNHKLHGKISGCGLRCRCCRCWMLILLLPFHKKKKIQINWIRSVGRWGRRVAFSLCSFHW